MAKEISSELLNTQTQARHSGTTSSTLLGWQHKFRLSSYDALHTLRV